MTLLNTKLLRLFCSSLILSSLIATPAAFAADLYFSWNPSGSDLLVKGYTIHYGPSAGSYHDTVYFDNPMIVDGKVNGMVSELEEGTTYYFVVSAYDAGGTHSDFSNEIKWTVPIPPPPPSNVEYILDNGTPETSSTGVWRNSAGEDYYGSQSVYSTDQAATYSFVSQIYGRQEISMRWTYRASRCSQVPVMIYDGEVLLDTLHVNQLVDGGAWSLLGSYSFSNGIGKVVILSADSSCTTSADAIRFKPHQSELDSLTIQGPASVSSGSVEKYQTNAHYDDGTIDPVMPEWSIDCPNVAEISTAGELTISNLSQEEHCTLTAAYAANSYYVTATKDVTIEFTPDPPRSIIVDNNDAEIFTEGVWKASKGTNFYGTQSVYSSDSSASFTFEAALTGYQEVYLWWTFRDSRCSEVPVKIYNGLDLVDTILVDQKQNDGQWNNLGTYNFSSGTALVQIDSSGSSCTTSADAAQFIEALDYVAPTPKEILLDNGSPSTFSEGTWKPSAGINYYGADSEYSVGTNASYTFETSVHGSYNVALWWTTRDSRCTSVPILIYDDMTLIDTVSVNQRENGGKWNVLGSYNFTGTGAMVILSEDSSCTTNADAVRFQSSN